MLKFSSAEERPTTLFLFLFLFLLKLFYLCKQSKNLLIWTQLRLGVDFGDFRKCCVFHFWAYLGAEVSSMYLGSI